MSIVITGWVLSVVRTLGTTRGVVEHGGKRFDRNGLLSRLQVVHCVFHSARRLEWGRSACQEPIRHADDPVSPRELVAPPCGHGGVTVGRPRELPGNSGRRVSIAAQVGRSEDCTCIVSRPSHAPERGLEAVRDITRGRDLEPWLTSPASAHDVRDGAVRTRLALSDRFASTSGRPAMTSASSSA